MIVVLGHGHSGTRVVSGMLAASGVYMGSFDPAFEHRSSLAHALYAAAKAGSMVKFTGKCSWDFTRLLDTEPPDDVVAALSAYLEKILKHEEPKGWKLPENVLFYPWLTKLYPEAHYVWWQRDPRNVISYPHSMNKIRGLKTDSFKHDWIAQRCVSWAYSHEMLRATPQPKNLITVSYEDFVENQRAALDKLESFLGIALKEVGLRPTMRKPVALPKFFSDFLQSLPPDAPGARYK